MSREFRKQQPLIKRNRRVPWVDDKLVKLPRQTLERQERPLHFKNLAQVIRAIKSGVPLNGIIVKEYFSYWDKQATYVVTGNAVIIFKIFEDCILIIALKRAHKQLRVNLGIKPYPPYQVIGKGCEYISLDTPSYSE